jgi:hypothetical protein
MAMTTYRTLLLATLTAAAAEAAYAAPITVDIGGTMYTAQGLVGVGRIPAAQRDKFGETFGSISGLYADPSAWSRSGGTYTGQLIALPDRGYNVVGTIDYAPRINTIDIVFTPVSLASNGNPQTQVLASLADSLKLFERTAAGRQELTGLDPVPGGLATGGARPGTPQLPTGFNGKLSLDAEAIVRMKGGGWLIGDEYGVSIYQFTESGRFVGALPIPDALRPIRGGVEDYSSNNPATGQPAPVPPNPTAGRQNNQGLEGMSISPDGKTLIAVLQSAARQDLNSAAAPTTRRNTRILTWDISDIENPVLTGHYALQLPTFGASLVAAQSEIYALSDSRFLILPRDGNGRGANSNPSLYRQVDIVDFSAATNLLGTPDEAQIAPLGILKPGITPATLTPWLNINDEAELGRFGLTSVGPNTPNFLSDKWEGLALLPVLDPSAPYDFFLFVGNDNDFLTTNGFQVGEAYDAGIDNDTLFLVYRVTLPGLELLTVPAPAALALFGLGVGALAARRRRRA